jgi:hypothetical protein
MEERCREYAAKLDIEPYLSIVPDRYPAVKVHRTEAHAKRALSEAKHVYDWDADEYRRGARGGEIYERVQLGWLLLWRVESMTPADQLPWKEA